MNCYKHSDRAAVGICKSCGKGLCRDCLTELPDALACREVCESRARLINQIIDNNARIISAARLQIRMSGITSVVLGGIFILLAWWSQNQFESVLVVATFGSLGAVLVVHGLMRLNRKAQYPRIEDQSRGTCGGER